MKTNTRQKLAVQQTLLHLRGAAPTRHQLTLKLLKEQPHLRINTNAFNESLVIRAIYVAGINKSAIANFTGFSVSFVTRVMDQYRTLAMKAYRAHVDGHDYEPTVVETFKSVGRAIGRFFEKRKLQKNIHNFTKQLRQSAKGQA